MSPSRPERRIVRDEVPVQPNKLRTLRKRMRAAAVPFRRSNREAGCHVQ